jgi:ABC-2 type transport system ATP-binding protein
MIETCIEIVDLTKKYKNADKVSLDHVGLSINTGDKFGILGPNGAGKTTLISIVCGVIEATDGSVEYYADNQSISISEFKKIAGFVPQEYAFYQELTPLQNLEYFGALYNLPNNSLKEKYIEILQNLGLGDVIDKKINTFSSGMKRRVNLAIGIIHKPKLLFLDEPVVGIDVQSKNAILKFLNVLNKSGTTIIYTSHQLSDVEVFCNHIALLDNGKLIKCDAIENIVDKNESKTLEDVFLNLTGEAYRD